MKEFMHYQFPKEIPKIDGTMAEYEFRIAASVVDTTEKAIVQAIRKAAYENGVTDLYIMDEKFVLDALREKAEREDPKPLTIEELRQMDQEPVYVVLLDSGRENDAEWCVMWNEEACIPGDECWAWPINTYGKTWIAYRHKPKETK